MATSYRIYHGFMHSLQRLIVCYVIFLISINPSFLYAQTLNVWSVTNTVRNGLTSIYSASKTIVLNGASVVATSSASILPVATDLAFMIARNGLGIAGIYAVGQLLGVGVQYVLDNVNKNVVYTPTDNHHSQQYYYQASVPGTGQNVTAYSMPELATLSQNILINNYWFEPLTVSCSAYTFVCSYDLHGHHEFSFGQFPNPLYVSGSTPPSPTNLPYADVANKIMQNAQAGNTDAKQFVYDTADSSLNNNPALQAIPYANVTKQFDRNIAYPTNNSATTITNASSVAIGNTVASSVTTSGNPASGVASEVTTTTASSVIVTNSSGGATINLPKFCEYAPMLCDFFKDDVDLPEGSNSVDVPSLDIQPNTTQYFSFGGTCPNPSPIIFSLFGNSQTFYFDYMPFCNFLAMVRPFLIGSSYIAAAYIILGLSKSRGD